MWLTCHIANRNETWWIVLTALGYQPLLLIMNVEVAWFYQLKSEWKGGEWWAESTWNTQQYKRKKQKSLFSCTGITWVEETEDGTSFWKKWRRDCRYPRTQNSPRRPCHSRERVGKGSYLFTSSTTINRVQAAVGGVGFILTSKAFARLTQLRR